MDTEPRATRFEIWPVALASSLLFSACVLLSFWWIAASHPIALVSDDSYAASLLYNRHVERLDKGRALGWQLELVARERPGAVRVEVEIQGGPLPPSANIGVRREHPSLGGLDHDFDLHADPSDAGRFLVDIPLPRAGRWRLIAWAGTDDARVERAIDVRAQ